MVAKCYVWALVYLTCDNSCAISESPKRQNCWQWSLFKAWKNEKERKSLYYINLTLNIKKAGIVHHASEPLFFNGRSSVKISFSQRHSSKRLWLILNFNDFQLLCHKPQLFNHKTARGRLTLRFFFFFCICVFLWCVIRHPTPCSFIWLLTGKPG